MSTKSAPVKKEAEPEEVIEDKLAYEDLYQWTTQENIPVFVACWDDDDTLEVIEAKKHKVYYILAQEEVEKVDQTSATKKKIRVTETNFYKVVKNRLGRSISRANHLVSTWEAPRGLTLDLPKIPIKLMNEIDSLFRHVYSKLKTEAIVILTYDNAIGGAEGWGFVVPEQKNTAAACDYDPKSVQGLVPKTAFVAGSVHSHPNMSAYASHTDEGDQTDFDGVHITIGWSAKTNYETEYYIEVQMQNAVYRLNDNQIFSFAPKNALEEEVLEAHMKNIDKGVMAGKAATIYTGTGLASSATYKPGGQSTQTGKNKRPTIPSGVTVSLPKGAPSPYSEVLIGCIDFDTEVYCPFCASILTDMDHHHHRCLQCTQLLMDIKQKVPDLIAARKKANLSLSDFEERKEVHVYLDGEFHKVEIPQKF